jgi:hypothetical protein
LRNLVVKEMPNLVGVMARPRLRKRWAATGGGGEKAAGEALGAQEQKRVGGKQEILLWWR